MYRFVLYCLIIWLAIAAVFGALNILPFSPLALLYSTAILLIVSYVTNKFFALAWNAHTNNESVYITALILALIISPPATGQYLSIVPFLIWAAVWAMASKYIVAIFKKHIFNPAAVAVVITALAINQSATWWIGTLPMLPYVLIGGLMIVRKIRRFDLVISFTVAALVSILVTSHGIVNATTLLQLLPKIFVESPIIFFATVMLTEPLTTPPTRSRRIAYGIFTGLLFAPNIHVGPLFSTPELALVTANVFSWLLSPKFKSILTLKSKEKIASDTGEFVFSAKPAFKFRPGQYLEWTLPHAKPDTRGNRRYFTIASAPSEKDVRLTVKFDAKRPSTFKKALAQMDVGDTLSAGQLSGDFVLPDDKTKKLVFIAGGIGVTPFRSMIGHLLELNEPRDIVLLYSARTLGELAYTDTFTEARTRLGIKMVATLTDLDRVPADWAGHRGYVNAGMIAAEVPDYRERTYFISGPHALVDHCKVILKNMDIPSKQIHTDYFPGF